MKKIIILIVLFVFVLFGCKKISAPVSVTDPLFNPTATPQYSPGGDAAQTATAVAAIETLVYLLSTPFPDTTTINPPGTPTITPTLITPIFALYGSDSGDGQFEDISHLTTDNLGNLYVVDRGKYYLPDIRVQKFSSNGQYIKSIGSCGTGDGQFLNIDAITCDRNGNVYIGEYNYGSSNPRIQKFSSSGTFLLKWGDYGSGDGQFHDINGICTDYAGNVYVAESSRIQKFSSSGTFVAKWGSYGDGDGQFQQITAITSDSDDNIYVADYYYSPYKYRVQKFSSDGTFLGNIGSTGSDDGQFGGEIQGLAADSANNIFTANQHNCNIQKFTSAGNFISTIYANYEYDKRIAIDYSDNIYVVQNDIIIKYPPQ